MSINLLELMQGAVGNQLIGRVAGILGEDSGAAQKAVGGILPSLLGGLIGTASTPQGAEQLANVVDQADGTIIDNIDKILDGSDGGSDRLLQMGNGLVNGLLGDKLAGVIDIISKMSGLGKGGTGSLIGMVAPLIFSLLGKQKSGLGLDAGGLAKLLLDQSGFLKGVLPKGMAGILGLGNEFDAPDGILDSAQDAVAGAASAVGGVASNAVDGVGNAVGAVGDGVGNAVGKVGDVAGDAVGAVGDAAGDAKDAVVSGVGNAVDGVGNAAGAAADATGAAVKKSGGFIKLLLPLLILLALLFLAWKFLFSGKTPSVSTPSVTAPSVAEISPDNALSSMKGILSDTTSTFGSITDEASAQAAAPKFDALTGKVKAINGLASKLPAGMSDSIAKTIVGFVGKLEKMVEKAYAIPGVQGIIEPKVDNLVEALNSFGV